MKACGEKRNTRRSGGLLRMAGLALCLCCAPFPALAGQSIVWNGAGAPGTTGEVRPDPVGNPALYPDGPSGNSVTVNADLPGVVYGGLSDSPDSNPAAAAGNRAVINGGSVTDGVYGGYAERRSFTAAGTATATGNSAVINGGSVGNEVYGGYAGSNLGTAVATGNSVVINGGSVGGSVFGGSAISRSGSSTATGNSVTLNGGSVAYDVKGGYVSSSGSSAATGNSVTVNGGSIMNNVYGGSGSGFTGNLGTITAAGNSVVINGGTVEQDVYGGHVFNDTGTAAATGNSVVITGGSLNQDVVGGYTNGSADRATGNRITLSGAPVFASNSVLYGGRTKGGDAFSGNTLNVWNYTGSAVGSVMNFQYYNFMLPSGMRDGETLLAVSNTASFSDARQSSVGKGASSVTGLNIMSGGTPLRTGESVTLMSYGTLDSNTYAANGNSLIQGQKGVSLLYDFQLNQTATALTATVASVRAHPQTKALSEGRLAGLAFVNQGADLIAGIGMDAARRAASTGSGFAPFFATQGGTSRYDTGSHVDVNGFSLMTGLAWSNTTRYGNFLLGAFFESGWGNYDSHNSFSGFASVKGDGDTNYRGGGVLGRMEFPLGRAGSASAAQRSDPQTALSGEAGTDAAQDARPSVIYVEASFRGGRTDTDFSSSDLREPLLVRKSSYDSGSAYYGAHAGLGSILNISEFSSLDVYARYFWTHQDSDNVRVTDAPIHFKAADSHRLRTGARFSHSLLTDSGLVFTPYIGAAYEHEFDAKARATTYGYGIDAPDLQGGTGIGELGLSFQPSAASGLSIEVAVQGYTGMREGVSGGLQAKWKF